jgi:hypothetical protein
MWCAWILDLVNNIYAAVTRSRREWPRWVRLYWMLRTQTEYPEIVRIESNPPVPRVGAS